MKRKEPRLSIPILLIAAGELFLILAILFHGIHKRNGMYATGILAGILLLAGIAVIIGKNRRGKS